ncbi:hypothetical protein BCR33DRAFT_765515 [Rhizoclosmatium globosum]|uniref:G-protein coupled receptors family 1 profile domain-containing protein n=1 Tax=Rhizoclosmatium globosum TaxID=329046 RepID=A0A1Y2CFD3_9FUNG|nr:hypothetical protein BCR33DRAFT_765515 [Rhizoclosmatium globosum]|eukprot:ORY45760.1 hypothetical protein BCR33DRAFT_765515 [Rhizoclosmatium globosum]
MSDPVVTPTPTSPPTTFLPAIQTSIIMVIYGLIIEVSITSLISISCRFITTTSVNYYKSASFLILYNIVLIAYSLFEIILYLAQSTEYVCTYVYFYENALFHLSVIIFDAFILFKMYFTTRLKRDRRGLALATSIILFIRIGWAVYDTYTSRGIWGDSGCEYEQNSISSAGYNITDIFCDLFATTVSIVMNWGLLRSDSLSLARVLVVENITRSSIVFSANIVSMYIGMSSPDAFTICIVFTAQVYIYSRCMNMELFTFYFRSQTINSDDQSISHAMESDTSAVSKNRIIVDEINVGKRDKKESQSFHTSQKSMPVE